MLYEKLFPFQKDIIDSYIDKKRLGLFLDMGLGKTILSLGFVEKHQVNKVIIVSILSKVVEDENIKGSFHDYLQNDLRFKVYKKDKKTNEINPSLFSTNKDTKEALIINYHTFINKKTPGQLPNYLVEFIKKCSNEKIVIILDESHKVKNGSSQISKGINKLINYCNIYCDNYLYLLTGTPFTQGFIDLYNQLKLLGCNLSKTEFINHFCIRGNVPGLYNWQQPIVGYKNTEELYSLIHKYAITELSKNNLSLPNQIFNKIKLPQTLEFSLLTTPKYIEKILYTYLTENRNSKIKDLLDYGIKSKTGLTKKPNPLYRNFGFPDDKYLADIPSNFWLRSRQLSIGFQGNENEFTFYNYDRVNKLKELLKENPNPYIIFYNYTPELRVIFDVCYELGYKVDAWCGDIKDESNYLEYKNMNEDQKINDRKRVILANFSSGAEGKNWQEYNHTIFFSVGLYGMYVQALKRNHRLGQTKPVYYYQFYQDNFLDRGMLRALEEGIEYNNEMFEYDSNYEGE